MAEQLELFPRRFAFPRIEGSTALSRLRAPAAGRRRARRPDAFAPYQPMPGVLPPDHRGHADVKLAMDQQTIDAVAWAGDVSSAFAEGTTFLGYAFLAELAQRPEYRVMSEVIAYEMIREWIEFKSVSDNKDKASKIKELNDALDSLNARSVLRDAAMQDGFFGRGHIYLDTGDTDDRDELKSAIGPGRGELSRLKVNRKKPLRALRNVEPVWTYPTTYDSNDPLKGDWYKPTHWFVMGKELHATRLLTFIGREVPDLLKPAYAFGGLSLSQMAKPYVDNWLRTRQSIADLIHAFSTMVLSTNMASLLQNGGAELLARLELFNLARDNRGVMVTDKDTEDFHNVSAPIGGLEGLQAQTQEHMAAISRIPIVKLLGIQPAGLNASSEGEIRVFYDWIHAYQEHLFRRNLDRIVNFVQLSIWDEVDDDLVYEFKSLWQLDEAGKAGIQQTKAATIGAYVEMGAVAPATAARVAAEDPDSPFAGIDLEAEIPEGAPEESEENLLESEVETGAAPGAGGPNGGAIAPGKRVPGAGTSRLGSSVTNRAARFGGATSGGFRGDAAGDDRKLTKAEVGFEHPARGPDHCHYCRYFVSPGDCDLVDRGADGIDPEDWCEEFSADPAFRMDVAAE